MWKPFRRSTLFLSAFLMLAAGTAPGAGSSLADYLPKVQTDAGHPDVQDADRGTPGRRGGELRLRTPGDYQHLNALTVTGQPEALVIAQMSDALVERDPETLEYFGDIAWSWRETDLLKLKSGAVREGRIIARDADTVTFVPGAWIQYVNRAEAASFDAAAGTVTLTAARGGAVLRGKVEERLYTIVVDEAGDPAVAAKAEKVPVAELVTWKLGSGAAARELPFANERCAFEFLLRDGVTWQDGQPVTAQDVVFSIQTIKHPAVDAQRLRAYYDGVILCEPSRDGKGVRMHYDRPFFAALDYLGGIRGNRYLVPRHIFKPEQFGGDDKAFAEAFNKHPFKEKPIYSGPYRLAEWRRGETLRLERHTDYWKSKLPAGTVPRWTPEKPYLDALTWVVYTDVNASIKDLQNGRLDVDADVEPSTWFQPDTLTPEFQKNVLRVERTGLNYTYIGWNLENPLFQDKEVRRALAMLVPRDRIIKNVYRDLAIPTSGPTFVLGPGYDKGVEPVPYDPEKAKRLLARKGWLDRNSDGILEKKIKGQDVPFRFRYSIHNMREYHQKVADILKESFEQARMEVGIVKTDWTIFADSVRDKKFDAVRFAWSAALDPDLYQIWHSSQTERGGDNFIGFKNARVDQLCEELRMTFDPLKRWEMAREIHRIVADEQPVCFLENHKEIAFIARGLRGVKWYYSPYPEDWSEWWWSTPPTRN